MYTSKIDGRHKPAATAETTTTTTKRKHVKTSGNVEAMSMGVSPK